ncbi:MAG: immunity 49 family protein [Chitinophaga sp.]|uniref:Imm49 family immunity protein n=1 Tax=Chitinophaga sp. TaxID=1869181 RepID=UPI0025C2192B|nr:Imm49 family immunity protein [Chitinophaga sp.]MBV8252075.1 immunity 49 family protein [Chitinophaga sp.]
MKLEQLETSYNRFMESKQMCLDFFPQPGNDKEAILIRLGTTELNLAVYEMYVKKDFSSARCHFYTAALLRAYQHNHFETGGYTSSYIYSTQRSFCFAVLSDNSKLIEYYTKYKDTFDKSFPGNFCTAIQAVITGDNEGLKTAIAKLEKHVQKKTWEKTFAGCVPAFKGLLENNSTLLQTGIRELLTSFPKQDNPAVSQDLFSIEATALAKLGVIKGMTLQIDSPLVPAEMLTTVATTGCDIPDFVKELSMSM